MKLTEQEAKQFHRLSADYKIFEKYIKRYSTTNIVRLDYHFTNLITLFTLNPDFDFETLEAVIERIVKAIPAIKKIFDRPLLHLKEKDEILPVESVHVINNDTIRHISCHSELWDDITAEDSVKPIKLLTKTVEDDYGIYENIVFCETIDEILSFMQDKLWFLRSLIFSKQTIELNLAERTNHSSYFLALGKLHTGYLRNFDKYFAAAKRCLNQLNYIYKIIMPRLKKPVYWRNRNRKKGFQLHCTNILAMHKDYHQIYVLLKLLKKQNKPYGGEPSEEDILASEANYFYYCELLTLFAARHFNFSCPEELVFSLKKLNTEFKFKKWRLTLTNLNASRTKILVMKIQKEKVYQVAILPLIAKEEVELQLNLAKTLVSADEYVVFYPYEEIECPKDFCYIRIDNVESFRRIQQILLRAMLYVDTARRDCPFCGNKLVKVKNTLKTLPIYCCEDCRLEVAARECPVTGKRYLTTGIMNMNRFIETEPEKDKWINQNRLEAQLYYRNITDITEDMEFICPHCGRTHEI